MKLGESAGSTSPETKWAVRAASDIGDLSVSERVRVRVLICLGSVVGLSNLVISGCDDIIECLSWLILQCFLFQHSNEYAEECWLVGLSKPGDFWLVVFLIYPEFS